MSLLRSILFRAFRTPRRVAVVDDQRQYTYARLAGAVLYAADRIEASTSAKHVGLLLPTSGAFPITLLATWLLGRTAVPLNYLLSKSELAHVVRDSDIDTIITVGPMLEFLGGREALPAEVNVVALGPDDFKGFPTPRWPAEPDPDALAALLYTSGTSGKPKGVMLTHRNLEFDVHAAIEHAGLSNADTFLGVLPQFHSFGLTALTLMPLHMGAKVVYTARFVPRQVVQLIRKHRPDIFVGVPSMYGALLSLKSATRQDMASVRLPISGGEPLPQAVYDGFRDRFDIQILEGYGLTETAPVTHWSTPTRNKLHSVGQALPGVHVLVVDEHDRPLPADSEGEILLSGPNVMQGYYKQPELTAQVFVDIRLPGTDETVRAFRTGDIGRVDEQGYLFITGRKKEMLIIGGENVFPREIEEVLNRHPHIKDSAVIGQHDPVRGEVPIAFVEVEPEAAFDAGAVRDYCRQHMAQYKVPRQITPIDELPRSPTGKILRRSLRERT